VHVLGRAAVVLLAMALVGCGADADRVRLALTDKYTGHSVDQLVLEFGPPESSFKMTSGETSYQWDVARSASVVVSGDVASVDTSHCRVRALVGQDGRVRDVWIADKGSGDWQVSRALYGSYCPNRLARRLGRGVL